MATLNDGDLRLQLSYAPLLHRSWSSLGGDVGWSAAPSAASGNIIRRMIEAYQLTQIEMDKDRKIGSRSMWATYFLETHGQAHQALLTGDDATVAEIWRKPADGAVFRGFDEIYMEHAKPRRDNEFARILIALRVFDNLRRLAEAIGAVRLEFPEAPKEAAPGVPDVEEMLCSIDAVLGFTVDFPNPYPDEFGLLTSRGVAGYRAVQALYHVWRARELLGGSLEHRRIAEIGPGLARTAYYAFKMGCRDYTLIDLPFTGASQAHYLSQALGEDVIRLHGESQKAAIKISPPWADIELEYDLMSNIDSITEMDPDDARDYVTRASKAAPLFLSVNHEFNPFTFREIVRSLPHQRYVRYPAWMRRGYVEEIVWF